MIHVFLLLKIYDTYYKIKSYALGQASQFGETPNGSFPANDAHECVDIARGPGARQRVAMVGRPLVDELAVARRPRQQHPSGAAAEGPRSSTLLARIHNWVRCSDITVVKSKKPHRG